MAGARLRWSRPMPRERRRRTPLGGALMLGKTADPNTGPAGPSRAVYAKAIDGNACGSCGGTFECEVGEIMASVAVERRGDLATPHPYRVHLRPPVRRHPPVWCVCAPR